ncbi:MCE family protein [Rhodovastum atsumiense]|uniref:MCE family protein n=1 Tax=Rhodovastum atsumiense TaxID=504468 RepID=A0A5M6ITQ3_9PROT|nr:MlaD family protein [Rhodovastum atsumiense]KAA5611686.1 MCE family protein [Rhodovastum atsumiense]CAH2604259.1 MCE family protein [Rhodovastum atsumiense]
MSGTRGTFLRVGLLLATGIAVAVGLALFLGGNRIRNGQIYETYFNESVQGLNIGAPVKFRGVSLGEVTEIGLVSAVYLDNQPVDVNRPTDALVYVRYMLDLQRVGRVQDGAAVVRGGLRARLANQGITGLAYIELDFVDPRLFPEITVPWRPHYPEIPSMPSTIVQVQDAAQALLARINSIDLVALGHTTQTVLDDVHRQLTEGEAQQALVAATELMHTLRGTVEAAQVPALAAELQATAAALRRTLSGPQSKETMAAVARAANRFAEVASRLPALVVALEAVVRRSNTGIVDLQAELAPVLRDARAATANLRETTETLRRYPAGALLGGPPPRENGR